MYGLGIIGGVAALLVWISPSNAITLAIVGMYVTFLVAIGVVLGRTRPYVLGRVANPTKSSSAQRAPTIEWGKRRERRIKTRERRATSSS